MFRSRGEPEPTMTPEERLARWESLAEHMDEWWAAAPGWRDEARDVRSLGGSGAGVRRAVADHAGLEHGRFPPHLRRAGRDV